MSDSRQPQLLLAKTSNQSSGEYSMSSRGSGSPPNQPDRTGGGPGGSGGGSAGGGRPKRTLIESACSACRRRKSRCDGLRPACSRCQALRTECSWEAEEGESRWSALRRRNQILETERAELRELISYVQSRPAPEAENIYHRLRALSDRDDVLVILQQVRDGELLPSPGGHMLQHHRSPHGVGSEQHPRLPPIRTAFDGINIPARPGPAVFPPNVITPDPSSRSQDSLQSQGSYSFPATTTAP